MKKYIVIYGNPGDGFHFIGPFDTIDEATEYGKDATRDWWIAELNAPADGTIAIFLPRQS